MPAFALSNNRRNSSSESEEEGLEDYNPKKSKASSTKPNRAAVAPKVRKPSTSMNHKLSSSTSHQRARIQVDEDEDDDEENVEQETPRASSGRMGKSSTASRKQPLKGSSSSAGGKAQNSNITTTEEDSDIEEDTGRNGRALEILEEKYKATKQELAEVQGQFDELRELRNTDAERDFREYRKASETRQKRLEDHIASLKVRVVSSEKRVRKLEEGGVGDSSLTRISATPGMSRGHSAQEDPQVMERIAQLERERNDAIADAKAKEDQAKRLASELKTAKMDLQVEVANSKALQQLANPRNASKSIHDITNSQLSSRDLEESKNSLAAKDVYADLTGIIFTKIEVYLEKSGFRRFYAVYSKKDSYDLEFWLEESESEITDPRTHRTSTRLDLIYTPQIEEDRDAALTAALKEGKRKAGLLNTIRFERQQATNFFKLMSQSLEIKK